MKLRELELTGFIQLIVYALLGKNITILGSPKVLDERISMQVFYTMHTISVLGKEAKSWFYIKYSIYLNITSLEFVGKSPLSPALSAGRESLHMELKLRTYLSE